MKTRLPGNFPPLLAISQITVCGDRSDKRNQIIYMRLYRLVSCIILSTCISGCALGIYGIPLAKDDHKTESRQDLAESLIGKPQENVVEKIGQPAQILDDGKQQYMIYEHRSTANILGMVGFIIPVAVGEANHVDSVETLHCLKIDLDDNNLVVAYKFKSRTISKRDRGWACPEEFWNEGEWQSFENLPIPEPPPPREWELQGDASWPQYGPPSSAQ